MPQRRSHQGVAGLCKRGGGGTEGGGRDVRGIKICERVWGRE